jgi:POT family proton-dependent oligopeptide transporter
MNTAAIDPPDTSGAAAARETPAHSMIGTDAGVQNMSEAMSVAQAFPKGLWRLCLVEFLERASFYGIRAILILYMVAPVAQGGLALPDSSAAAGYGLYLGAVYLSALLGGWIGDRWLGARGALLAGAIAIVLGHLQLGLATTGASWLVAHGVARQTVLAASLATIVLGTGLFKPNIAALVGHLYDVSDRRRDRGFTRFYMMVNAGGLAGGLTVGWIAARFGWTLGFLAASLGVVLCVVVLATTRIPQGFEPAIAATDRPPFRALGIGALAPVCAWAVVSIWALTSVSLHELGVWSAAVIAVICMAYFYLVRRTATAPERRGIEGVIVLFAVGVVFIFGFEQAGSWMTLFAARDVQPSVGGFRVPAAWYTGLNDLLVVLMAPVVGAMWTYRRQAAAGVSTHVKLALGLVATGVGFLVIAIAAYVASNDGPVLPLWLLATYAFHTFGELCIGPVSLSAVSRLSPPRLTAQLLGMWYASAALGTLLGGLLLDLLPFDTLSLSSRFCTTAVLLLVSGVVLWRAKRLHGAIDC